MNRDRAVNLAIAIMQGNTSDHGSVAQQIAMLGLLALVAALTTATAYVPQVEVTYNRRTGNRAYPASLQNDIGSGWGSTESTERSEGL